MAFAFLTSLKRQPRSQSLLTKGLWVFAVPLALALAGAPARADDTAAPGWLVTVKGKTITTPNFPGSDRYSFISFPAVSIETPNLADHLVGRDDSLSLVLFSPHPSLSVGAIGRYDPNNAAFESLRLGDRRWVMEPGVFAEYWASSDSLRIRGELRMGADGATGMTGDLSADFVQRLGKFVIAAGPHMGVSGLDYANAHYADEPTAPLPGTTVIGARSFGASGLVKFAAGQNWSTSFYANYDRIMMPSNEPNQKTPTASFNDEVRVGASFNLNFTSPSQ